MTDQAIDERLFDVCQPSALGRLDDALAVDAGTARELADAKAAVAAVGLATVSVSGRESASGASRARLLASLGRGGRYGKYADRIARMFDMNVDDATALLAKLDDPSAWSPFLVPGVDVVPVPMGPRFASAIGLIARIPAGTRFPEHTHRGEETMFILDGGLREDGQGGHEAWRGDELVSSDGSNHAFVALDGGPCIAASIIDGVVEFA